MSLSVKYSRNTEKKLQAVLRKMMSEALLSEPKEHATGRVADMVGEVVQLLALCHDMRSAGKQGRYDMHVYINSDKVEWQYFQVDR
ncbi:MAG: hypothetical protein ACREBF_04785 [Candidatus Micrarchaeales archaeon]